MISLSIKKKYFNQIKNEEKTIEYRAYKNYYIKLFNNKKIDYIRLHYYKKEYLIVKVEKILLIDIPIEIKMNQIVQTDLVFAIYLSEVKFFKDGF